MLFFYNLTENEVEPISQLFNCSSEVELPKIGISASELCDVADISHSYSKKYPRARALVQQSVFIVSLGLTPQKQNRYKMSLKY